MNIVELIFYFAIYAISFFVGHHVALSCGDACVGMLAGFATIYALLFSAHRVFNAVHTPKTSEK